MQRKEWGQDQQYLDAPDTRSGSCHRGTRLPGSQGPSRGPKGPTASWSPVRESNFPGSLTRGCAALSRYLNLPRSQCPQEEKGVNTACPVWIGGGIPGVCMCELLARHPQVPHMCQHCDYRHGLIVTSWQEVCGGGGEGGVGWARKRLGPEAEGSSCQGPQRVTSPLLPQRTEQGPQGPWGEKDPAGGWCSSSTWFPLGLLGQAGRNTGVGAGLRQRQEGPLSDVTAGVHTVGGQGSGTTGLRRMVASPCDPGCASPIPGCRGSWARGCPPPSESWEEFSAVDEPTDLCASVSPPANGMILQPPSCRAAVRTECAQVHKGKVQACGDTS